MPADPQAVARHYVPRSDDVLFYTDIVPPGESFTIYFRAPLQKRRNPLLLFIPRTLDSDEWAEDRGISPAFEGVVLSWLHKGRLWEVAVRANNLIKFQI